MTTTSDAKRLLAKTIRELREKIILPDLREATERAYQLAIDAKKATLSGAARAKRARIEAWLDEQTRGIATKARPEAKQRLFGELIKDAGATLLHRLVYLRLTEANGLRTVPVVTGGWDSRGYKDFREVAPELVVADKSGGRIRDDSDGYSTLLALVFDELALDLPGLFGPVRMTSLVPVPAATLRSIIKSLDDAELASVWTDDTTLGWIYQYWNDPEREALDKKLAAQKKLENHEIASKTQMFTERYMVEWLLHNSLGQLWLAICQKHGWTADVRRDEGGGSVLDRLDARRAEWRGKRERGEVALDALMPIEHGIEDRWKYWVSQPMPDDAVTAAPDSVRDVKLLDPACGSGHFLVIAFELLLHLYKEEARHRGEAEGDAWSDAAIIESILAHNVHGIDIDPRAIQAAAAALMLKAKLTCKDAEPRTLNLVAPAFRLNALGDDDPALRALVAAVEHETGIPPALTKQIVGALAGADHLGSLLKVDAAIDAAIAAWDDKLSSTKPDQGSLSTGFGPKRRKRITGEHAKATLPHQLERFLAHHTRGADLGLRLRGEQLAAGVRFMRMVRENQYDLVVGNPPYQGTSKLADKRYVETNYPRSKADLYAAFIERGLHLVRDGGTSALLTMRNWMFIKQFSALREWLLETYDLRVIGDMDRGAFDEVPNEVLAVVISVLRKAPPSFSPSVALQPTPLDDKSYDRERTKRKRAAVLAQIGNYRFQTTVLKRLLEAPLIYWWSEPAVIDYASSPKLGDVSPACFGMNTGDNRRFIRYWWELPLKCTGWAPCVKGSTWEWIDPIDTRARWQHSGLEIKVLAEHLYGSYTRQIRNEDAYLQGGIAFSKIGSAFAARLHRRPAVLESAGSSILPQDLPSALCLLNSSYSRQLLAALNPTVNFTVGDVNRIGVRKIAHSKHVFRILEDGFSAHESHREPSLEFRWPGPSSWSHLQRWAQFAVDLPDGRDPPAPPSEQTAEGKCAHLSFAIGVALGRFGAMGEGILTECPPTALPHGILYLSDATNEHDSLAHAAAKPILAAWEEHGADIDASRPLKDYLRDKFFPDVHRKMYENRPIYFALSSSKRTFVAFISIHRWTDKTLTDLLAEHLLPEKKRLTGQKADLATARDGADKKAARAAEKQLDSLVLWLDELNDFIAKIEQIAHKGPPQVDAKTMSREVDAPFAMDLDDGVMINSAALWPLLEPQWKDPKKWWKELANAEGKKDCDWAHLAARYFQARVDAKCKADPSLAVAHGCFWKYHPAKAYQWELRLQDEIRPDFTIDETGSSAARTAFLSDHADLAGELVAKEDQRRERKRAKAAGDSDEAASDEAQIELGFDEEDEREQELTA